MGIRAEISEGMNYGNDREELAGQEGNRSRNVVAKERNAYKLKMYSLSLTDTHNVVVICEPWRWDFLVGEFVM